MINIEQRMNAQVNWTINKFDLPDPIIYNENDNIVMIRDFGDIPAGAKGVVIFVYSDDVYEIEFENNETILLNKKWYKPG